METVEIKIKIPEEVIKEIPNYSDYTYEKLILGLYQDAEISLGKAAELLHKTTEEFIQYLVTDKLNSVFFWQNIF